MSDPWELWEEADMNDRLWGEIGRLHALNTELVEALEGYINNSRALGVWDQAQEDKVLAVIAKAKNAPAN